MLQNNIRTIEGKEEFLDLPLQIFGEPQKFDIVEVKTNPDKTGWWTVKVKFSETTFEEFFPNYTLHFILDPEPTKRILRNRYDDIMKPQESLFEKDDDLIEKGLEAKRKYQVEAKEFGMHTFHLVRLKEYKADENTDKDTITFIMGKNFVQFLLDRGSDLPYMKLVLNNPERLEILRRKWRNDKIVV